MKTYIYGEVFVKTPKNLYMIKSFNLIQSDKKINHYYIAVKNYSHQKGKTNCFSSADGNHHITELREANVKQESILFNEIKEYSKLYRALIKRIQG